MKTVSRFMPAIAMIAALCAPARQATAQTQKLAVINMQTALAETVDGKKAVADLRAKFGPKDQEFQRRSQELQAKQDQLKKAQATMSEDALGKLQADIAALTRSLQRDSDDAKADMDQEEQKMVQDLGGKIVQVINKYASDNGYTMVFDVSGQPNNIMFASAAVDITREIIAMYDKAAPTTPMAPPASVTKAAPAPATQKPAGAAATKKP